MHWSSSRSLRREVGCSRCPGLLNIADWAWFDVLHIHTVELAVHADVVALVERLRVAGKRLIVTEHDLHPNIESDVGEFNANLGTAARAAQAVLTLTTAARDLVSMRCRITSGSVTVAPHGAAIGRFIRHRRPQEASSCTESFGRAVVGADGGARPGEGAARSRDDTR